MELLSDISMVNSIFSREKILLVTISDIKFIHAEKRQENGDQTGYVPGHPDRPACTRFSRAEAQDLIIPRKEAPRQPHDLTQDRNGDEISVIFPEPV
jgi:hypothetical protein